MDIVILHRDGSQLVVDRQKKQTYQNCLNHGWELLCEPLSVEYEYDKNGAKCGVKSIQQGVPNKQIKPVTIKQTVTDQVISLQTQETKVTPKTTKQRRGV